MVEVEDVLRVICVLERGQARQLIRRIGATHTLGAFVAQGVDVLASRERVESRGRSPRERDSCVVLRRSVHRLAATYSKAVSRKAKAVS